MSAADAAEPEKAAPQVEAQARECEMPGKAANLIQLECALSRLSQSCSPTVVF